MVHTNIITGCKRNVFCINFAVHLFVMAFSSHSTTTNKPLLNSLCHIPLVPSKREVTTRSWHHGAPNACSLVASVNNCLLVCWLQLCSCQTETETEERPILSAPLHYLATDQTVSTCTHTYVQRKHNYIQVCPIPDWLGQGYTCESHGHMCAWSISSVK